MRAELLYNPRALCERLAVESVRKRRLAELRGTVAESLQLGHIDTLELVRLAGTRGIDVVYDIGANVGTFSLLAKSLLPHARIHAFEPLAEQQARFRETFAGDADVTLHPIALGSEDGAADIHVMDFADASSMLPPTDTTWKEFGVREVSRISVPVLRLDHYRAEKNLPIPDLIKLDIQGYELNALQGGEACLAAAKAVITEVSFIEYYGGQCLFHEVVAWLAARNFFIHAFGINTARGEALGQTDVLFMRREHE